MQLHRLALPKRLHQPPAATAPLAAGTDTAMPRWRRSARAAAIGTSVGVGVTGTLLLSLWQMREQLHGSADGRQAEIRQLLGDSSRELLEVAGTCARVGAHTLGHVEQLRALDGSDTLSVVEQTAVTRLMERLKSQCESANAQRASCGETERKHQDELCEVAQKDRSSSGALSYWHPSSWPPDAIRNLLQVWVLLRGEPRSNANVALAPPAPAPAAVPAATDLGSADSAPCAPYLPLLTSPPRPAPTPRRR